MGLGFEPHQAVLRAYYWFTDHSWLRLGTTRDAGDRTLVNCARPAPTLLTCCGSRPSVCGLPVSGDFVESCPGHQVGRSCPWAPRACVASPWACLGQWLHYRALSTRRASVAMQCLHDSSLGTLPGLCRCPSLAPEVEVCGVLPPADMFSV